MRRARLAHTRGVVVWALISEQAQLAVSLYLDEDEARHDLELTLLDEPAFTGLLEIVELDWPLVALN